jgi:glycosyltransferase involved in cell wall biosynthesis
VVAPQLQWLLSQAPVHGIPNGAFLSGDTAAEVLGVLAMGGAPGLRSWKRGRRHEALVALDRHAATPERPVWGDRGRFRREPAPWFVMGGRDDPVQKGYDVAAAAARELLGRGADARVLVFPLPGDEGIEGLRFLADLAWDFPGEVLVLPFRWVDGYLAAVSGADFGLMPSLYEPFGAANEISLLGSLPVARATGGLVEQVIPLRSIASFNHPVHWRSARFHDPAAPPTGILFREYDGIASGIDDWRSIYARPYTPGGGRLAQRWHLDTWRGMVASLVQAMDDALAIAAGDPRRYAEMVRAGGNHVRDAFSWERAAHEYASFLTG